MTDKLNPLAVRLDFLSMPTHEIREYHRRFIDLVPERIAALSSNVRLAEGYSSWVPDHSGDSLGRVGDWLQGRTTSRALTPAEIYTIERSLPVPAADLGLNLETDLSDATLSHCTDVGMYLAISLIQRYPALQWSTVFARRSAYYGQPVLMGCWGKVPLNPVAIASNLAYSALVGKTQRGRLREVYEFWCNSTKCDESPDRA